MLQQTLGGDDTVTAADTSPSTSSTPTPSATPTPSPSATPGAGCTYTKSGQASKDVGLPTYDATKAASYRKPFTATIKTNQGDIVVQLAADKAPCTANSFKHLAESKYYDGSPCHRLTTDNIYVLQCGDPTGSGSGGPGYQFGDENAPARTATTRPARWRWPDVRPRDQRQPVLPGLQGHPAPGRERLHDLRPRHQGPGRRAEGRRRRVSRAAAATARPVQKVTVQTVTIGKG